MSVGQGVRRLRLANGRSLRALARAARYSPSQLSRVEREIAPPPAPRHRLYGALDALAGDGAARDLVAAARVERGCMLEGIPWRRRARRVTG